MSTETKPGDVFSLGSDKRLTLIVSVPMTCGSSRSTRTLILLDFVLVTSTFRLVPYIGWIFAFGYTLLVNSYYCFE